MKATTQRLLAHAKEFFVSGERELETGTNFACMQAVLKFHDAVEFCVRAVIEEHMVNNDRNADLMPLMRSIDQSAPNGKKLPLASQIDFLNSTRAKVKHHGSVPSNEDTQRCHMHANEFLDLVSRDFLGVEFRSVSRLLLIEDASVRHHLEMAESKCEEGDYLEALISTKKAFYVARPSDGAFVHKEPFFSSFFLAQKLRGDKDLHKAIEAIIRKIDKLEGDVALFMMGVDILKFQRFEAITPHFSFDINGGCSIMFDETLTPNGELAREAIAYVTDMTLLWQRRGVVSHRPERSQERGHQRRPWIELRREAWSYWKDDGSDTVGGPSE